MLETVTISLQPVASGVRITSQVIALWAYSVNGNTTVLHAVVRGSSPRRSTQNSMGGWHRTCRGFRSMPVDLLTVPPRFRIKATVGH